MDRRLKDATAALNKNAERCIWGQDYATHAEAFKAMYNHAEACGEGEFEYQFSQFVGRYMALHEMH